MRLLLLSALLGLSSTASNVTYFGAPRLSLGDTLPNTDRSGHLIPQVLQEGASFDKPICGNTSGTASRGRSVAYYQAWNVRTRPCDKVWPSQIKTTGLTHLNLAFASIDPKSFKIRLENDADGDVYRQFVALKHDGLQTWLAVGGWEFSDEGETRTTWSDMTSTQDNRKTFIDSTLDMLKEYGFQGLDIDWEWPASANRGGNGQDTQNQVSLLKELREAFGSNYGLTCALPQDAGFLKGIDIKSLAQYVDWFNILTYDLHGAWDAKVSELGPKIRPHTDLKEIDEHLDAIWATGVDPKKFTLGLAYYGRGYTASNSSCLYYGCEFTGPSHQGPCSQQDGIMSNCEIKRIVKEKHLTPGIISGGASAMQVFWDDQWIGYDNEDTFALKKGLADDRCMSGTAIWAIDYDSCDEGGTLPSPGSSSAQSPASTASGSATPSAIPSSAPAPTSGTASSTPISSSGGASSSASSPGETPGSSSAVSSQGSSVSSSSSGAGSSVVTSQPTSASPSSAEGSAPASSLGTSAPPPSGSSSVGSETSASSPASQGSSNAPSGSNTVQPSESSSSTQPASSGPSESSVQSSGTAGPSTASGSASPSNTPSGSLVPSSTPTESSAPSGSTALSSTPAESSAQSSMASQSSTPGSSNTPSSSEQGSSGQPSATSTPRASSNPASSSPQSEIPSSSDQASSTLAPSSTVGSSAASSGSLSTPLPQSSHVSGSSALSGPGQSTPSTPGCASLPFPTSLPSMSYYTPSSNIWDFVSNLTLPCSPPCTYDLPPSHLPSMETFYCPYITKTLLSVSGGETVTSTRETDSFACGSVTKVQVTDIFVNGGSTGTVTSTIGLPAITTDVMSFWPLPVSTDQSVVMPVPKPFCGLQTTTLPPGVHPLPPSPTPQPTSWPVGNNYCLFPDWPWMWYNNLPWECCLFDWCRPLYTLTPFPSDKPSECSGLDWCSDWPWTSLRSSTPSSSDGSLITLPSQCTFSWCPPYSTIPVQVPPRECTFDWCADWPLCWTRDCKDKPKPPKPPPAVSQCVKDCGGGGSGGGKKCEHPRLFGCGCGWMGLPFGPGCPGPVIDLPKLGFDCGLFGCDTCPFFGCPGEFGLFGFDGFCLGEGGCDPNCPKEICSGPKCTLAGGCGPKSGEPTSDFPASRPKSCEEKDRTTVTDVFSRCTDFDATTGSSSSSCTEMFRATLTGCGIMGTTTTTRTSKGAACTKAPLSLDDDEGDNEGIPPQWNSTSLPSRSHSSNSSTQSSSQSSSQSDSQSVTSFWPSSFTSISIPTIPFSPSSSSSSSSPTPTPTPTPSSSSKFHRSTPPEPSHTSPPLSDGGVWKVKFHQTVDGKNSNVHWTLYDSNGNEAGFGDGSPIVSKNRPEQDSLPFEVDMDVTAATDIDRNRIRFSLKLDLPEHCKVRWETEQTGKKGADAHKEACPHQGYSDSDFGCDDLRSGDQTWRETSGGHERYFGCYFKYLGKN